MKIRMINILVLLSGIIFCISLGAEEVAVVLATKGKVYANAKKRLRLGDRISETDEISTAAKSTCELQLLQEGSPVVIRMKENANFSLTRSKGKKGSNYRAVVKRGKVLFNVNKLGGGRLKVISPTSVAGVRGTKFEMDVRENGENRTVTLEGAVASRLRIPELESMDNALLENNKSLQQLLRKIEKKSVAVKQGDFINLSQANNQEFLDKSGLSGAIDPTDDKQAAALAKKDFSRQANSAAIKIKRNRLTKKVAEKKRETYEELIPVDIKLLEDEKEFHKELNRRNKEQRLMAYINSLKRALREAVAKNHQYSQKLNTADKTFSTERQQYRSNIKDLNQSISKLQKQVSESRSFTKQEKEIQSDLVEHLKKLQEIEKALEKLSGLDKK